MQRTDTSGARKRNKPWFDEECREGRRTFYRVKNTIKFLPTRVKKEQSKAASKAIKKKKAEYFRQLHRKIRNLKSNNCKAYWQMLNSMGRGKKDASVNMELFREHFEKLSATEQAEAQMPGDEGLAPGDYTECINQEFTADEILRLIAELKNGKSSGMDKFIMSS